jgi:hypothetical protein
MLLVLVLALLVAFDVAIIMPHYADALRPKQAI